MHIVCGYACLVKVRCQTGLILEGGGSIAPRFLLVCHVVYGWLETPSDPVCVEAAPGLRRSRYADVPAVHRRTQGRAPSPTTYPASQVHSAHSLSAPHAIHAPLAMQSISKSSSTSSVRSQSEPLNMLSA